MFNYINLLSDDIIIIIFDKLNNKNKIFLNKFYYKLFNNLIDKMIIKKKYNNYIRDIICNNSIYVFDYMCNKYYYEWTKIKKFKYDNIIFNRYIDYLIYYCNKLNLNKILNVLKSNYKNFFNNKIKFKYNNYINKKWII